jgi:glycosyltransferase involved in cell wall biosynthesis
VRSPPRPKLPPPRRGVYLFPSSVDLAHFSEGRGEPDVAPRSGSRPVTIGYMGVIDERIDRGLIEGIASARPGWVIEMLGPIVKIDPESLPHLPNIHYRGFCAYNELPSRLRRWDVAMVPFARMPATRFVSPTKLLEYLAAGRPVVSTSIHDVVEPYGRLGVVSIADTVPDFVAAVERVATQPDPEYPRRCDALLARTSWDWTWQRMARLLDRAAARRRLAAASS